jgi:radical SAM protein with 4Fe4S-binding SPASM domain
MQVINNKSFRQTINQIIAKTNPSIYDRNLRRHIYAQDLELKPTIDKVIKNIDGKLFDRIEIETINRCNNHCEFCPVHAGVDPRTLTVMNDQLFEKIISNLKNINFNGYVALFSNNEPLLDPQIIDRIKYTKKQLPQAFHYLYTNGTLLNENKFLDLANTLDLLIIDNYADKMLKPVKSVHDKYSDKYDNVYIQMRRRDEILTTRGGQATNRQSINSLRSSCIYPFTQLVVRPDGKISLCCNDALGIYTLGDLNRQSLFEVWYSREYEQIRKGILNGRYNLDLCKSCDTLISSLEMFTELKN